MDKRIDKLKNLSIKKKELDSLLESLGFSHRPGKGSHERWIGHGTFFTVASHNKEVPEYILKQIRNFLLSKGIIS